ncbi:hypothetical protein [Nitrosomonas communis]|uniref:Uncharacterized protein n=1 Tax=Nitrosomonas communis TaxID=44574 RepID=A0A1H2YWC6_9PROT|nr:hypothetical protein [Nitrosomonas communis]SDX09492.1 hypothetical protein SAMN05421882_10603 [Nitrosomonas communis]
MRNSLIDKNSIEEAAKSAQSQEAKILDSCISGQLKNFPAGVYAALAQKYPEKFQSLEPGNHQNVALLNQGTTSKALSASLQYHYIGLDQLVPAGYFPFFSAIAITNGGRVYGNIFTDSSGTPYVATIENGTVTVLHEGFANTANEGGTAGGAVLTDSENFFGQAALFHGNKVELIPRLAGEIDSAVLLINDSGIALYYSMDENFNSILALY